jgi:hypothetical protein
VLVYADDVNLLEEDISITNYEVKVLLQVNKLNDQNKMYESKSATMP